MMRELFFDQIKPLQPYIWLILVFSFFFNLLMLTPPLYLRSVLDHAVGHRSNPTLLALTVIMVFLMIGLGFMGWARTQLAQRTGARLYSLLADDIFEVGYRRSVYAPATEASVDKLQDLSQLKNFISSQTFLGMFDLLYTPIFIVILFYFHFLFGMFSLISIGILAVLGVLNERMNGRAVKEAMRKEKNSMSYARSNYQMSETIDALGIVSRVESRWGENTEEALRLQLDSASREGILSNISRTFRLMAISLIVGLGAYLSIIDLITPGVVMAVAILLGRALGPVVGLVDNWERVISTREIFLSMRELFRNMPPRLERIRLPRPKGALTVEKVILGAPGSGKLIIRDVTFSVKPGGHLGIVGPSGAGKSTLARALIGLWPCAKGAVRLDGSDIFRWDRRDLGPHIGYLPQSIEVFATSVGDNIGRLGEWTPESVFEAAGLTGIHDMVLRLPQGYDTVIGPGKTILSGGQMQRVALARALYGNPQYVVLDEPSTNLDAAGQAALLSTIRRLKAMGVTLIVIAHDVDLLSCLDSILVLTAGRIVDYGVPEKILSAYAASQRVAGPAALSEKKAPKAPKETAKPVTKEPAQPVK